MFGWLKRFRGKKGKLDPETSLKDRSLDTIRTDITRNETNLIDTETLKRLENKIDRLFRVIKGVPRRSAKKTAALLVQRQLALQEEIEKLTELRNEASGLRKLTRTEKANELLKKSFIEQTERKLTDVSAEVAQGLILKYLKKVLVDRTRISVSRFKKLIIEEEKVCSRASFFRHLKTLEFKGHIIRERKGRVAFLSLPVKSESDQKKGKDITV